MTTTEITRLNYNDYALLTPTDSPNYELHNGKIITMPAPSFFHQRISICLSILMGIFILNYQLGELLAAPIDVIFTEHDVLQPDLLFISKANEKILQKEGNKITKIAGSPDLVVEILSLSTAKKDLSYKKGVYETSGVGEYWVVDLEKEMISQYINRDMEFELVKRAKKEESIASEVIAGLEIKVNEVFA